jgi:hypothetical protein
MIIDELFESPQQCPECGGISFSDLILAEKKDACYHKVKASAKVWPSAYASGRLVQCRKKGAANYGNKSEGVAEGTRAPNEIGGADSMRQKLGNIIKQAAQDDEIAYNKPGLYRKLWITYGGDIDAIIAERSIFELQQLARELVTANKQGMAEGALDDSNFGKSAALMTPTPQAAQQARDIVQQRADDNVISQAKIAGAVPITREGEQQPSADYRDPKEVDYDGEYDAMVARVKRLAGLGPMKTVYDPNKRVYRNMPTAVQPKK